LTAPPRGVSTISLFSSRRILSLKSTASLNFAREACGSEAGSATDPFGVLGPLGAGITGGGAKRGTTNTDHKIRNEAIKPIANKKFFCSMTISLNGVVPARVQRMAFQNS